MILITLLFQTVCSQTNTELFTTRIWFLTFLEREYLPGITTLLMKCTRMTLESDNVMQAVKMFLAVTNGTHGSWVFLITSTTSVCAWAQHAVNVLKLLNEAYSVLRCPASLTLLPSTPSSSKNKSFTLIYYIT